MKIKLGKVFMRTRNRLHAIYSSHSIQIDREKDGRFYIMVTAPSGSYCYDGWWGGSTHMKDAIAEALFGSCLLNRDEHKDVDAYK